MHGETYFRLWVWGWIGLDGGVLKLFLGLLFSDGGESNFGERGEKSSLGS